MPVLDDFSLKIIGLPFDVQTFQSDEKSYLMSRAKSPIHKKVRTKRALKLLGSIQFRKSIIGLV